MYAIQYYVYMANITTYSAFLRYFKISYIIYFSKDFNLEN